MTKPRIHQVGVIGLGNMGMRHVDIVSKSHIANLVAVADIDDERARHVAEQQGCLAFSNYQDLLDNPAVEMVMICTPDQFHVEPTLACAAAGKHIFLEKPIATTLEDADTIIKAVGEADVLFTVGHCLRFDAKYAAIKQRIDADDLGKLVSLSTRRQNKVTNQDRLAGRVSSQLFLGVHDYDIINWYLGSRPVSVYCESTSMVLRDRGYEIDDMAWTTIRYEDGAVAVAETGWLLPAGYPLHYRFDLTAYGSLGTAHLEVFDDGLKIATNDWTYLSVGDRLAPQLEHFLQCIKTGAKPLVSGEDARLAVEMALASEQSAREHQPVALPLTAKGKEEYV